MNIKNLKVGDLFSNETKLLVACGFTNNKSADSKKANIKTINQYLSYEKTGKISRGKVTNEIIITEIYDTPHDKIDGRVNNHNDKFTKYLAPLLFSFIHSNEYPNGIDYIELCRNLGLFNELSSSQIKPQYSDRKHTVADYDTVIAFKSANKKEIISKVMSSYNHLKKQTSGGVFAYESYTVNGVIIDDILLSKLNEEIESAKYALAQKYHLEEYRHCFSSMFLSMVVPKELWEFICVFLKEELGLEDKFLGDNPVKKIIKFEYDGESKYKDKTPVEWEKELRGDFYYSEKLLELLKINMAKFILNNHCEDMNFRDDLIEYENETCVEQTFIDMYGEFADLFNGEWGLAPKEKFRYLYNKGANLEKKKKIYKRKVEEVNLKEIKEFEKDLPF